MYYATKEVKSGAYSGIKCWVEENKVDIETHHNILIEIDDVYITGRNK